MSGDLLWAPWCLKNRRACIGFFCHFCWGYAVEGACTEPIDGGCKLRPNPVPIHWSTLETRGFLCCSEVAYRKYSAGQTEYSRAAFVFFRNRALNRTNSIIVWLQRRSIMLHDCNTATRTAHRSHHRGHHAPQCSTPSLLMQFSNVALDVQYVRWFFRALRRRC